jgi:hypothetical protein
MNAKICVLCALVLCLTFAASGSSSAAAYDTQGCPDSAPQWRILYRLHFSDNVTGRTLSTSTMAAVLDNTQKFTQAVGDLSGCAVRMHVDTVDDAGPYHYGSGVTIADVAPTGYDAAFDRYPAGGEERFSGETLNHVSIFPVAEVSNEPNPMLLMHEWLHQVVTFYTTPLGWPVDDVHGGCQRPDYQALDPNWGCMVLAHYFADMMTGKVMEDGRPKGLPVDQWAYQGTPAHPLHRTPELVVGYDVVKGRLATWGPAGAGQLKLTDAAGRIVWQRAVTLTGSLVTEPAVLDVGSGTFQLCLDTPESAAWVAGHVCRTVKIAPDYAELLRARWLGDRLVLRANGALRGRPATITFKTGLCGAGSCTRSKLVRRMVTLKAKTTIAAPRPPKPTGNHHGRFGTAKIAIKAFVVDGVRYAALNRTVVRAGSPPGREAEVGPRRP